MPGASKGSMWRENPQRLQREYRRLTQAAFLLCAEHVRQLGGGSPLPSLVEVKG